MAALMVTRTVESKVNLERKEGRCKVCHRVPKKPMYVAGTDGSVNLVCGVHRINTVLKAGYRTKLVSKTEFSKIIKKVPKNLQYLVADGLV